MPGVVQVEVSGCLYNIAQASAIKQQTLLTLIGSRITFVSASAEKEIDVPLLMGSLLTLSEEELTKVSDIVLEKVRKNGAEIPISIKDFQGQMVAYLSLIAEAIKVNLKDFFDYLDKLKQEDNQGKTINPAS